MSKWNDKGYDHGTLRNQESRAQESDPCEDTLAVGCTWRPEE